MCLHNCKPNMEIYMNNRFCLGKRWTIKQIIYNYFPKELTSLHESVEKFKPEGALKKSGGCGERQLRENW